MTAAHRPVALRAFQASLRHHREATGLSQERMAQSLGMTRQNYAELEGSGRAPTIVTAERLAQHFGASLQQFLDTGKEVLDKEAGDV